LGISKIIDYQSILGEVANINVLPDVVFSIHSFETVQKEPWFMKYSPNGRIPNIVDHDYGDLYPQPQAIGIGLVISPKTLVHHTLLNSAIKYLLAWILGSLVYRKSFRKNMGF
jgi:hypothetical protein